jgi:cyclohexanecarboxyl-CoA dehydrogenase
MIFNDDQRLLAETLRSYARERLKPEYLNRPAGRPDQALLDELADLGVFGLLVPEEHGGSGAAFVDVGIAGEELARGDFNVSSFVQLTAIASTGLRTWGTPTIAARYLPKIADGSCVPAIALTEPDAGSDAAAISTKASETDGGWLISGEKSSITFAGFADAAIVLVRTGGPGAAGISAFWVPLDTAGVTRSVYAGVGGEIIARGSIAFDDVFVPADHLLGEVDAGFAQAMTAFDFNRAVIALSCIGAAFESLDETVDYANTRHTFGKPLSSRQAITQQVAEHYAKLHAARSVAYDTLTLADQSTNHTTEAAMAKWMGPAWSADAIHTALRLHGWSGYGSDLHFDQRLRDVIGLEIGDGTAEIMKAIIARDLFGVPTHR